MSIESILAAAAARKLMPTSMSSRELRTLSADIRSRSLFAARTNSPAYLARVADVLDRLLGGEINQATARNELQIELDSLGYDPAEGFPGEDNAAIPPAGADTIPDISSSSRINLMLDTEGELLFSAGQKTAGMTRLPTWPAWELIRVKTSLIERDWPARWEKAGGILHQGRMVALKTDPIWTALGDSSLFDDALDVDTPPFAFNSGMGWEEVRIDEARALGLPDTEQTSPDPAALNQSLKASVKSLPPDLVKSLKKDLAAELQGSELRYQSARDKARAEYLARSPVTANRRQLMEAA